MITLTHIAVNDINRFNWVPMLSTVNSLGEFEDEVQDACKIYISTLPAALQADAQNKFLGDAFEVFVEMLMLTHAFDNRINVYDYKPLNPNEGNIDIGVDGVGKGADKKPATVQVKFRSRPDTLLTAKADGLSGFVAASQNVYGVEISAMFNMLVVTNCAGINYKTKTMMLFGKVRELNREHLIELVDNQLNWWDNFRQSVIPVAKKRARRAVTSLI